MIAKFTVTSFALSSHILPAVMDSSLWGCLTEGQQERLVDRYYSLPEWEEAHYCCPSAGDPAMAALDLIHDQVFGVEMFLEALFTDVETTLIEGLLSAPFMVTDSFAN